MAKCTHSLIRVALAGGLLLVAFLIQFTKCLPWPVELLTALRTVGNVIELTLLLIWCGSLRRRIVSIPAQRLLAAFTGLMVFWLTVRMYREYTYGAEAVFCWYDRCIGYVLLVLLPLLEAAVHASKISGRKRFQQCTRPECQSTSATNMQPQEQQWKIAEKNRLHDRIIRACSSQLEQMDHLLAEAQTYPAQRRQIMARICVLGAYIKRRANLTLLAEQGDTVPAKELEYSLWESLDNLRPSGVVTAINSAVSGKAKLEDVCAAYELFETVVELLYGNITAVMLHLSIQEDVLCLRLQIGCHTPVSPKLLSGIKAQKGHLDWQPQDEDILINLVIPEGGRQL